MTRSQYAILKDKKGIYCIAQIILGLKRLNLRDSKKPVEIKSTIIDSCYI